MFGNCKLANSAAKKCMAEFLFLQDPNELLEAGDQGKSTNESAN